MMLIGLSLYVLLTPITRKNSSCIFQDNPEKVLSIVFFDTHRHTFCNYLQYLRRFAVRCAQAKR